MKEILTVRELTERIQLVLESSFDSLWVEGEISNLRKPASGHLYFTLKDEEAQIRAVIFRPVYRAMRFEIQDGMHIICRGRLAVYKPRGEYQIIIELAEPKGIGALQIAFEQMKARLEKEGLFDPARKKPIPFLPRKIGVVTSPSGAVIRDILNITGRRFPSVDIVVASVRVQGAEAPQEIVEALANLNALRDVEVIIVARGGGSLEDLAPFNDERVARAIYESRIPVVSAVGHEIDFTIADFVADLRAPTPSAAAELVVPVRDELRDTLGRLRLRLESHHHRLRARMTERLASLQERLRDPRRMIAELRMSLDDLFENLAASLRRATGERRLRLAAESRHLMTLTPLAGIRNSLFLIENMRKNMITGLFRMMDNLKGRLETHTGILDSLSPLAILKRGYSIARKMPEGLIIKEAASLATGDEVGVKVSEGSFDARVIRIHRE
jgi:exodeoxyribonuclease VII large subunit